MIFILGGLLVPFALFHSLQICVVQFLSLRHVRRGAILNLLRLRAVGAHQAGLGSVFLTQIALFSGVPLPGIAASVALRLLPRRCPGRRLLPCCPCCSGVPLSGLLCLPFAACARPYCSAAPSWGLLATAGGPPWAAHPLVSTYQLRAR